MVSCNTEKDAQKIHLEIQLFEKTNETIKEKYSKDLVDLVQPFKNIGETKNNFTFYPLIIKRKDVDGNKVSIEYLNNKAGSDKKINFCERQLKHYFEDSTVNVELTLANNLSSDFNTVINEIFDKKNYFIYDPEEILKNDSLQIATSIAQLRSTLEKKLLESNPEKIVIIFVPKNAKRTPVIESGSSIQNPNISSFTAQPTSITIGNSATLNWSTQNATGVSISGLGEFAANSSTQVTPSKTTTYTLIAKGQNSETTTSNVTVTVGKTPPPPTPLQNDCNKQVSATSVQELFSKVASGKIPDCQKNSLMKSWSKYFTSDATVTYVHNDCSANLAPLSIENFLYAIKGKNKTPYIQSDCNNKKVGGKYQSLSVQ